MIGGQDLETISKGKYILIGIFCFFVLISVVELILTILDMNDVAEIIASAVKLVLFTALLILYFYGFTWAEGIVIALLLFGFVLNIFTFFSSFQFNVNIIIKIALILINGFIVWCIIFSKSIKSYISWKREKNSL